MYVLVSCFFLYYVCLYLRVNKDEYCCALFFLSVALAEYCFLRCLPVRVCLLVQKGSPYSTTERRVPELIPVLGSQPAGDVSHKRGGRLPLLSVRPAVTSATLKRTANNFAAW